MAKASARNIDCFTRRRRCPCGDERCYVQVEGDADDEALELQGTGDAKFPFGTPQTSLESSKVVNPPYVGQTFETDEEAQEYYVTFARKNGFAIRRERSKGNPEHPLGVYKRELVCHRAGLPLVRKTPEAKRQRSKTSARCKCEAQMVIKKSVSSGVARWVVVNFSNVHNHELLDSNDVRHLPAYRYISAADREHILTLAKAGCSTSLIIKALEMQKGVKQGELTFTERDLKNFLEASKSINLENEGLELLKVCKSMKDKNPDFRYDVALDESNKLEHIAWSYSDSIRAYKVFGDVVVFDTTYRLYLYDRPVGVWFGVDNHGHTIFFGCVLLHNEGPYSFRWALQSFVRLMDGKIPQTILTDLDLGLIDAISNDLPNTKHAIPRWHVMSKFPSWFSASLGSQYEKFTSDFQKLYDLEPEEFEHHWTQMVNDFGLCSDRHISLLSSLRSCWALPFLRGWFFGGLITSVSLMSIKSFFRGFLNSQTRLKDFVEQVGVAVDFQNQAGEEAMMEEANQPLKTKTCMPIEEHASTFLTQYAFEMLQTEIILSSQYAALETSRENYLVRHHLKSDGGHTVTCVPLEEEICCSCKGFESSGILCRHVLRILSFKNCFALPDKYILTRWRRESSLFPRSNGFKYRSQALCSLASILVQESSITKDRFDYIQWHLGRLLAHVRDMPTVDEAARDVNQGSLFDATLDIVPARTATRGRPRKSKGVVESNNKLPSDAGDMQAIDESEVASVLHLGSSFDAEPEIVQAKSN